MEYMQLESITQVISRYNQFKRDKQHILLQAQKKSFTSLIRAYEELRPRLKAIERKEASRFNIFEIMQIRYYEVKVHTPIIADLLNPNGKHGQFDLFYKLFIKRFIPDTPCFLDFNTELLEVRNEMSTPFGRLDVLVKYQYGKNAFAFVLENKIHAKDQPEQLKRYKDYLDSLLLIPKHNIRLFYLTLHGNDPCEFSIHKELYKELQENGVIRCLSYKTDILSWLTESLQVIKSEKVKITLSQYIDTLKIITNE